MCAEVGAQERLLEDEDESCLWTRISSRRIGVEVPLPGADDGREWTPNVVGENETSPLPLADRGLRNEDPRLDVALRDRTTTDC